MKLNLFLYLIIVWLTSCGSVKKQQQSQQKNSVVKEHLITDTQKQVQTAEIQQVKEISTFVGEEMQIAPTDEKTAVIIEKERTAKGEKIIVTGGVVKFIHNEQTAEKTAQKTLQTQQETQEHQSAIKENTTTQKQTTSHKERKEWGRWGWIVFGVILGAFLGLKLWKKVR